MSDATRGPKQVTTLNHEADVQRNIAAAEIGMIWDHWQGRLEHLRTELNEHRRQTYDASIHRITKRMVAKHGERICIDFAPFVEWEESEIPRQYMPDIPVEAGVPVEELAAFREERAIIEREAGELNALLRQWWDCHIDRQMEIDASIARAEDSE